MQAYANATSKNNLSSNQYIMDHSWNILPKNYIKDVCNFRQ